MNFNEARLHEAFINLHTHACIFSCLSIASVDGKQHLSEVVFSALVGFLIFNGFLSLGNREPYQESKEPG